MQKQRKPTEYIIIQRESTVIELAWRIQQKGNQHG